MSRAGSTLFFLPSTWIRGCCRTFNPEVFYIKYPTSYRNQAQDHYIQARVTGRGRTRTKRPLYYQSMSPDASRAAIGEYSKPAHLLAFIVQPARINVTCSAQGFPDSHRQIPNLSHYLYHVYMQSITDPPHTSARFKVRSSRNPSKKRITDSIWPTHRRALGNTPAKGGKRGELRPPPQRPGRPQRVHHGRTGRGPELEQRRWMARWTKQQ